MCACDISFPPLCGPEVIETAYLLELLHHLLDAHLPVVVEHLALHARQPVTQLLVLVVEEGPGVQAVRDLLPARRHLVEGQGEGGQVDEPNEALWRLTVGFLFLIVSEFQQQSNMWKLYGVAKADLDVYLRIQTSPPCESGEAQ